MKLNYYLNKYCPTLVSFILLSDAEWEKITQRFDDRIKIHNEKIFTGKSVDAATTLYDLIARAEANNVIAMSFLTMIDNIFKDISNIVPVLHHPKIRRITMNMLSDFDEIRSGYLNPLGELQALLSILKNSNCKLKEIEYLLPNGKSADYYFETPIEGELLVEVTNIHFKDGLIKNESDLITFLSGRVTKKLAEKITGVNLTELGKKFILLPVVWCDFEDIHKYQSAFDIVETEQKTLPFCVMGQSPLENGSYIFRFSTVKKLIESYHNEINYENGS